jgi:hypothetical protein
MPWKSKYGEISLHDNDAARLVSISEDLRTIDISKDVMTLSNAEQAIPYLIQNADESLQSPSIRISLRKWPSKLQSKQMRSGKFGCPSNAIRELAILLHIHYLFSKGDMQPNIACPIGMYDLHSDYVLNEDSRFQHFLAIPPISHALNTIVSMVLHAESDIICVLYTKLAALFCNDLIKAIYHCFCCGINFKWIAIDDLYISSSGSIMLCGLGGAEYVQLCGSGKSFNGMQENFKRKTENFVNKKDIAHIDVIAYPNTTSPEILLGSCSSEFTTIWTLSAICGHILSGKSVIKSSISHFKHVQYLYRVLGTPKMQEYDMKEFDDLIGSKVFGRYIINDDGSKSECRSRVLRNFRQSPIFTHNTNAGIIDSKSFGSILETLTAGLHLVPSKRLSFHELLNNSAFENIASKVGYNEKKAMVDKLIGILEDNN